VLTKADFENPYLKNKIKDIISRTLKTSIFEIPIIEWGRGMT
jgi:hypothetical protein